MQACCVKIDTTTAAARATFNPRPAGEQDRHASHARVRTWTIRLGTCQRSVNAGLEWMIERSVANIVRLSQGAPIRHRLPELRQGDRLET
jgi:hypothetical protein